jgi:hypothetical protein
VPCDPRSIERRIRQQLADGISGNIIGIWLLVPEHLRLGTWDLLRAWTGQPGHRVEPRLAMQLVHEAALCVTGIRQERCLRHRGFEVANGLPFVATDQAIHDLLEAHIIAEAQALQVALGRIRHASGHFRGHLLAIDPHRLVSHSKRRMRMRKADSKSPATKTTQTFFCLDADTCEPICFLTSTSSPTVAQVTPKLLDLTRQILPRQDPRSLVLADGEHFTVQLVEHMHGKTSFDLLVPMPNQPYVRKRLQAIPPEQFTPRWAGLATAKTSYTFGHSDAGPFYLFAQRCGERREDYRLKGFLSTRDGDEVEALTAEFPKRWHIEEFFNANQALGWERAGTQNLHIRYGQMTMALLAEAAISQLRQRLPQPASRWNAKHLAKEIFRGLDGDIRVHQDTIVVTYNNAPDAGPLREQFEGLPQRLIEEGVAPGIPWLYDLKLDFRFR